MTASNCSRVSKTVKSSSGKKLEGKTRRPWRLTTNGFIIHIPAALARHRSNPGCSAQQPLTARATLSSILPNRAISGSGGAVEAARIDLQLSSGSLRALRLGPESGAPVLCVPGLSANARSFDAVARRLAERGRAVVVVDLRGRG